MTVYQSPGVYVEEVPSSVKPIAGVSTSTAGFLAVIADTILQPTPAFDTSSPPRHVWVEWKLPAASTPQLFTNWTQFTQAYGGFIGDPKGTKSSELHPEIDDHHRWLAQAVYGFFNNGGTRCYVVRAADKTKDDVDAALKAFEAIGEIAIVLAPGVVDGTVREAVVDHCVHTGDRFAILDLDIDTHVLSVPGNTDRAAVYFPWIRVANPTAKLVPPPAHHQPDDGLEPVPPSGHVAGVYARVDGARGVHKAPANEAILGALTVTKLLSKADQDGLNPDGVNCLRVMNGNVMVWGARTIGGDANADLKYINVRRTLLFLEKSIEQGTQWVVFEPNTSGLWQKITRNVTAFLTEVWRSGALFGDTPQQAFYVKCDEETNPPALLDLGQVVTEVGVAIARPAEFVVFRISQYSAPSA